MRYLKFKDKYLGRICRNCLEKTSGIKFSRYDCHYAVYPYSCASCKKMKNIVLAIRPLSRFKVLIHKEKDKE